MAKKKILVVDDDISIRRFLIRGLKEAGYSTVEEGESWSASHDCHCKY